MARRAWFFQLAIAACAVFAIEANAGDREACTDANPDVSILGCTAIIDAGIDSTENIAISHYNRGRAFHVKGDLGRAIADYDRAIELSTDNAQAYGARGTAYANRGNYDRAIADFDKAIALNSKDAAVYFNRGLSHYHIGDYGRAIADYGKAIALNPEFADAYGNRGVVYEKQGRKQKAEADYRKALALRPGNEVAIAGLQRLSGASAKPAAPAAKGTFKHFPNTDFAGALLKKTPADSAAGCEAQCQANSDCAAFTFNAWNAACFLKSGVTAALLEPSSVSGLPAGAKPPPKSTAAESMVRYRGKAFPGEPASAGASASFVTCEARCEDDPHCVAFSYVKESSICREFARAGEYSKDSGIDSGVKRQAAQ